MHVRCPHCHNPIEIIDDSSLRDIPCPSCGSSFSLVADETVSFKEHETKTLGHFELVEKIGVGAFGTVWKARDTELDRTVAIKVPRKDQLSEQDTEQFLRDIPSLNCSVYNRRFEQRRTMKRLLGNQVGGRPRIQLRKQIPQIHPSNALLWWPLGNKDIQDFITNPELPYTEAGQRRGIASNRRPAVLPRAFFFQLGG